MIKYIETPGETSLLSLAHHSTIFSFRKHTAEYCIQIMCTSPHRPIQSVKPKGGTAHLKPGKTRGSGGLAVLGACSFQPESNIP